MDNIEYKVSIPKKKSDFLVAAAAAKLLQSCPTLCDPIDGSPPGFPIPGILQARTLEWAYRYIVYIKINRILYISNKFHFIS